MFNICIGLVVDPVNIGTTGRFCLFSRYPRFCQYLHRTGARTVNIGIAFCAHVNKAADWFQASQVWHFILFRNFLGLEKECAMSAVGASGLTEITSPQDLNFLQLQR